MLDTPFVRRAYNLGLKATANFADILTEAQIEYYEQHLGELSSAIRRGFILPDQPVVQGPSAVTTDTEHTLDWWLDKTQEFAKTHLGVEINLRERFAIPAELPWKNVIPVFDPGTLTNRGVVEQALKALGLTVYEETDVMKYAGSEALNAPTLHFIEDSVRPNADTMNVSPNQLRKTGKSYLSLRGYGLAFAVYHFATGKHLDPETFTWFPEDRLSDDMVASGDWRPDDRKVGFYWDYSGYRRSFGGARVAISVSLVP